MKKFIFTFMVCLFAIAMDAQNDWTVVYSSATSTQQYECKGKTKSDLWRNLKRWVALNFNSYKFVADMEDEKSGEMILKVTLSPDYSPLKYWVVKYPTTIDIVVQDGIYTMFLKNGKFECAATDRMNSINRFTPSVILDDMIAESNALKDIMGYDGDCSIEHVYFNINFYSKQMNNTPKYRKPKDERKGRVDSLWKDYNDKYNTACSILTGYSITIRDLKDSLEKDMRR